MAAAASVAARTVSATLLRERWLHLDQLYLAVPMAIPAVVVTPNSEGSVPQAELACYRTANDRTKSIAMLHAFRER